MTTMMFTSEQLEAMIRKAVRDGVAEALRERGDGDLLTPEEAAEFLGITTRTLRTYEARGLPALRHSPRIVRYRRVDLIAWARSRGNG